MKQTRSLLPGAEPVLVFLVAALLVVLPSASLFGQDSHGHSHDDGHSHDGHSHEASAPHAETPEERYARRVGSATAAVRQVLATAEAALANGESEAAESFYRGVLLECWILMGSIEIADGKNYQASRAALAEAMNAAAKPNLLTRTSFALIQLWTDDVEAGAESLGKLAAERPRDTPMGIYHVQALVLAGRIDEARTLLENLRDEEPEAVASLEKALEETEGDAEARRRAFLPYLNIGVLAEMPDKDLQAMRAQIDATRAATYRNLAVLHSLAGREDRAASYDEAARNLDPEDEAASKAISSLDLRVDPPNLGIYPLKADESTLWTTATVSLLSPIRKAIAGQAAEAETELREILENGDDPAARDMLGILLADRGAHDEALEQFNAAVAAEPEFLVDVYEHLARLHVLRGDDAGVVQALRAGAEAGDLSRDLILALAEIELAAPGRERAAENLLNQAVQRFKSIRALLHLAKIEGDAEGPKAALVQLDRAQSFAYNSEVVLDEISRVAFEGGLASKAKEAVDALLRMHPTVAEYSYRLGRIYLELDEIPQAATAFERSLKLDSDSAEAQIDLALTYNFLGRHAEARDLLTSYVEAEPNEVDGLAGLAEAELALGAEAEADERSKKVLATIAAELSTAGNEGESSSPWRTIRAHRQFATVTALMVQGKLRLKKKDFEGARNALLDAADLAPGRPGVHLLLSEVYTQLGDEAAAEEHRKIHEQGGSQAGGRTNTLMDKISGDS